MGGWEAAVWPTTARPLLISGALWDVTVCGTWHSCPAGQGEKWLLWFSVPLCGSPPKSAFPVGTGSSEAFTSSEFLFQKVLASFLHACPLSPRPTLLFLSCCLVCVLVTVCVGSSQDVGSLVWSAAVSLVLAAPAFSLTALTHGQLSPFVLLCDVLCPVCSF